MPVPQAPGLGVTVDEDLVHRLRRPDASPFDQPRTIYTVRWADGRTAEYVDRDVYEPTSWPATSPCSSAA